MNAPVTLSPDSLAKIDKAVAKYPPDRKDSAVMAALTVAQDEKGWLSTETMDFVAQYLGMPPVAVYEVASFYTMYDLKPTGKYKLTICTNLPCALQGATSTGISEKDPGYRFQRNHSGRPHHAEGGRMHGRLRRCTGADPEQQENAVRDEQ